MAPTGRRRPTPRSGTSAAAGEETRERILDAALATLTAEGFLGTTARSIARTGGFNQALLFYHYGSVDEVLVAAVERMSERRLAVYRERVEAASDLPSIVAVARDVLGEDMAGGAITVLAQLVAGAHGRSHIASRLARVWDPWIDVVEAAVLRVVAGTGFAAVIPARDLAFALTGMFLGVELLSQLDPDEGKIDALFASIDTMAALLQGVFLLLQTQQQS